MGFHVLARSLVAITCLCLALSPVALADDLDKYGAEKVCTLPKGTLDEISGMAMSPTHAGVIWAHNDSGGGPYLYAVDSQTCEIRARITINGIEARDLEAIAVGQDDKGRPAIWLGDIGDNLDSWETVRLHRIREPEVIEDQTVKATTFEFTYPDRPHNAETLLADPDSSQVWVVTKQLARGRLYALPRHMSPDKVNIAKFIRRERGLITDGAISPDGSRYALRDYVDATVFDGLPPGSDARIVMMPFEVQGEAIAWTQDGSALLIASERDRRLLRVPVDLLTAPSPRPTPSTSEATVVDDQRVPGAQAPSLPSKATDDFPWLIIAFGVLIAAAIGVVAWLRAVRRE